MFSSCSPATPDGRACPICCPSHRLDTVHIQPAVVARKAAVVITAAAMAAAAAMVRRVQESSPGKEKHRRTVTFWRQWQLLQKKQ